MSTLELKELCISAYEKQMIALAKVEGDKGKLMATLKTEMKEVFGIYISICIMIVAIGGCMSNTIQPLNHSSFLSLTFHLVNLSLSSSLSISLSHFLSLSLLLGESNICRQGREGSEKVQKRFIEFLSLQDILFFFGQKLLSLTYVRFFFLFYFTNSYEFFY